MDFTFLTDAIELVLKYMGMMLQWFGKLFKAVFTAFWNVLQDFMCLGIDVFVAGVKAGLSGVASLMPAQTLQTWQGYWANVPQGLMEVAIAIGIVPALSIIAGAIAIRLALQLIPFTRLGS